MGWDPSDPVGETRWLHGIVGYADLAAPNVAEILDAHLAYPNFRGIRQSMNYHHDKAKTYLPAPEVSRTRAWRRGIVAGTVTNDLPQLEAAVDRLTVIAETGDQPS